MKRTILLPVMMCGVLLSALGCDREAGVETREAGLRATATALPLADLPPLERGEVLLDAHPKSGAIVGVVEDAPENSDAFRILRAVVIANGERTDLLDGVQDARFMPDGSIVAISRRNELVRMHGAEQELLASDAVGTLSAAGSRVAFMQGDGMPDYQVVAIDVETGERWESSPTLMPSWSPVLSDDGAQLLFASGHTGVSTMVRGTLDGKLEVVEEFPTETPPVGPNAPVWLGDEVIFESEKGTRRMQLPSREETTLRGSLPVKLADGRVMIHDSGTLRAVDGGVQ